MKTLYLPVKKKYFDQIKSGEKKFEYRVYNDYWERRLSRPHDQIVITLGYPKKDDHARRIVKPYKGFNLVTIKHPEWNNKLKACFAIIL